MSRLTLRLTLTRLWRLDTTCLTDSARRRAYAHWEHIVFFSGFGFPPRGDGFPNKFS